MRLLLVDVLCGVSSTGRICTEIAKKYESEGWEVKIAYGRHETVPEQYKKYAIRIGSDISTLIHVAYTRLTDRIGFCSNAATKRFLRWADEYDPDLLWLHDLHGYYINVEMLFNWIKSRPQMQVRWTQHDCWAFTGHCSYFTAVKCEQWKGHCSYCVQKRCYPTSYFIDNSFNNFERKRAAFTGVKNMTLITPSQWLADLVKQSFLKDYPVEVIHNTINTSVFKPTPSDFRERYGLQGKKVVLGVAYNWTGRKGLNDFFELAKMLDDQYVIILVGLDKKQIRKLPKKIKGLCRTDSSEELAAIYTMADVFVNPSREETFGMTTLEAMSCGTKSIVYEDTAGKEVVIDNIGVAVPPDVKNLYREVIRICGGVNVNLNCRMIFFPRMKSAKELAEIYTAADVFVNPTYEDNYPTVNLEAKACGTYVITYQTGGSAETLFD